jgi:hypothetical protein
MAQNRSKGIAALITTAAIAVSTITYFNTNQSLDLKSHRVQAVVIHCSATREGQPNITAKVVDGWHTQPKPKGRGERVNPYNAIVEYSGNVVWFRPWDTSAVIDRREVSWGSAEYNICSFNICYVGGCDRNMNPKNTLTTSQDSALKSIVFAFLKQYPKAYILGHNSVARKACPSFDVKQKCLEWGVPVNNIWRLDSKYKIPEKYGKVIFKAA